MHNSNNLSKSYKEIIKQHVFTLFNGINVVLAIFVFFTGSYRNMLFMITVIFKYGDWIVPGNSFKTYVG